MQKLLWKMEEKLKLISKFLALAKDNDELIVSNNVPENLETKFLVNCAGLVFR